MASILLYSNSNTSVSPKSHNVLVETSTLFLNHYKNFVKLLYDSMDDEVLKECLKIQNESPIQHSHGHHHHHHHHNHLSRRANHSCNQHRHSIQSINYVPAVNAPQSNIVDPKFYSMESLTMYLERLVSTPRSLKSIARRRILTEMRRKQQQQQQTAHDSHKLFSIANQMSHLALPKRVRNYMLFIE
jgi:hypothetical protein